MSKSVATETRYKMIRLEGVTLLARNLLQRACQLFQPRSQVLFPTLRAVGTGRREPWERGCNFSFPPSLFSFKALDSHFYF